MKKLLFLLSLIISINSCKKDGSEDEIPNSSKTPYWEINLTIDGAHYKYKSKARSASILNSYAYVREWQGGWWIEFKGNTGDPEFVSGKSLPYSCIFLLNGVCEFIYKATTIPDPEKYVIENLKHVLDQTPELANINQKTFEITYNKPLILKIPKQTIEATGSKSSVVIEGKIIAYRDIF